MSRQQVDQEEMSGNGQHICDQCPSYQNETTFYEECNPHFQDEGYGQDDTNFRQINKANFCSDKCRMPMCSPFLRGRKYIQPPRQPSCKPIVCYKKPSVPLANETIYKKSFESIDPTTAVCCRLPIIRPRTFLKSPDIPFEKDTVSQLSFPPYCMVERTKPIIPKSPSLLGTGPMQEMTTQKHDFVPKFQYRRLKIFPRDNMKKLCGCVENATTQRLSFMPPCIVGKRESFKPVITYKKSEIPMEYETTQKLSFMPICPPAREELPWAKKAKYQPPSIEFAKDTITKLSYLAPGYFVDDDCENQLSHMTPHIEC